MQIDDQNDFIDEAKANPNGVPLAAADDKTTPTHLSDLQRFVPTPPTMPTDSTKETDDGVVEIDLDELVARVDPATGETILELPETPPVEDFEIEVPTATDLVPFGSTV